MQWWIAGIGHQRLAKVESAEMDVLNLGRGLAELFVHCPWLHPGPSRCGAADSKQQLPVAQISKSLNKGPLSASANS